MQRFTSSKSIPLLPLPCSAYIEEDDAAFIRVIAGGSAKIASPGNVTPESMIAQLHQCRIAVLGSYHAAVFALAQGVPVIGLYRSAYYRDKFMGLAHLFGSGVIPIDLSEPDWPVILESRLLDAWNNAPVLRPQLQSIADEHLRKGRNAFQDACRMVEGRFLRNEALLS
jgi:colanic acid/amylovoran biosynthesis protein